MKKIIYIGIFLLLGLFLSLNVRQIKNIYNGHKVEKMIVGDRIENLQKVGDGKEHIVYWYGSINNIIKMKTTKTKTGDWLLKTWWQSDALRVRDLLTRVDKDGHKAYPTLKSIVFKYIDWLHDVEITTTDLEYIQEMIHDTECVINAQ